MQTTINVGVVGYRGSGKTTLCYKLVGIDPPRQPNGTTSLDYLACTWDGHCNVLAWDFAPGVSPDTQAHLDDMDCVVLCCDGRNNRSAVHALQFLRTCKPPVVVALTRMTPLAWCVPLFFADIGQSAYSAPVLPCYHSADALISYLHHRFASKRNVLVSSSIVEL